MDRRVFIQGLVATGTALSSRAVGAAPGVAPPGTPAPLALPQAASAEAALRSVEPGESGHENLWPLLAPLAPGDAIGLGWVVVELSPVSDGAAILTLASGAQTERVQLCRLDGAGRGVAHSDGVDLVLTNRTGGVQPTDESLARVLNVLALLIRGNERAGVAAPEGLVGHNAFAFFRSKPSLP